MAVKINTHPQIESLRAGRTPSYEDEIQHLEKLLPSVPANERRKAAESIRAKALAEQLAGYAPAFRRDFLCYLFKHGGDSGREALMKTYRDEIFNPKAS